jgi:hypothetical protein
MTNTYQLSDQYFKPLKYIQLKQKINKSNKIGLSTMTKKLYF